MTARSIVIAGTASGVGKTTVTLGLLEAFQRRGLRVRAFKVGPDFIDPGFHAVVTGQPSYTLDGWMCSREQVVRTVARHASDADLAVVEGVMGCFDGSDGATEDGSTAQVAKWLGAPVVLVVDASALARSAAAIVLGFERFDPDVDLAAVVFNRVAGEVHARSLRDAVQRACRAAPVGFLPVCEDLSLPERHLGLVTTMERRPAPEFRDRLATVMERHVDLDRLLSLAAPVPATDASPRPDLAPNPASGPVTPRARIGVAYDRAFQFYYAENLDLLRAAGAELVFWSPLRDATLPDVGGLYLGGGYPEVYARQLADNESGRAAVRRFAEAGRPIYAECGGLMYLAERLEDADGVEHPMVGVLPAAVRMRPGRLRLAYTEVELIRAAPIGEAGAIARGHEFHCSTLDPVPARIERAYRVRRRPADDVEPEGYVVGRTLMSYVHLHFGGAPAVAPALVTACAS
jgi:cobyrinic acid a,c-diamide synthase